MPIGEHAAAAAAALTAFLLGATVGRGEPLTATAGRIVQLARGWAKPE